MELERKSLLSTGIRDDKISLVLGGKIGKTNLTMLFGINIFLFQFA